MTEIAHKAWEDSDRRAAVYQPYVIGDLAQAVFDCPKTAIIVVAPRDLGKTALAVQVMNRWAKPGTVGAWGSIEYKHITRSFLPEAYTRIPGCRFIKDSGTLYMPNTAEVMTFACRDVGGVDRIRGVKRPDYWIWDEAAFYHPDFFLIAEPNYRPGTKRLYVTSKLAGSFMQDLVERIAPNDPDYFAVFDPQTDEEMKPAHLTFEEWMDKRERARLSLPEAVFNREYLNQWGSAEGAVFRIKELIRRDLPDVPGDGRFAVVIDWARDQDFTTVGILGILNINGKNCHVLWILGRWQGVEYDEQLARILRLLSPYKRKILGIWHDATGGDGKAMTPQLRAAGYEVHEVIWSRKAGKFNSLKERMVYDFSLWTDRQIFYLAPTEFAGIAEVETRRYESHPSSTPGRSIYGAPPGLHDDCVALELMCTVAANQAALTIEKARAAIQAKEIDYINTYQPTITAF